MCADVQGGKGVLGPTSRRARHLPVVSVEREAARQWPPMTRDQRAESR